MYEKFYRAVFFSIFSLIGILSVSLAILGPEWKHLYKIKAAAIQSEQNNAKIEQLLDDHQSLINLINTDPNILIRLAPVELGETQQDPNAFVTQLTADALSQAKAVIDQTAADNAAFDSTQTPTWLLRATVDSSRIVLFTAGAGLILVSFVCFSTPARKSKKS
ncbi:MAG: hypothetical protein A2Y10_10850 [Planctomycetes bacterium GWF2_41_51]|nr:MAG: hypothetical protein A2Y10_10850 [Planctomycetes bacterium GWF2_41_51]HBG28455.1 hypothetical protein [Phycisphaerales bacterium]